jgi:tRNA(Met) cytidine acetyltransferase
LIGAAHGFVWGAGALILRLPPINEIPIRVQERLAVHPHTPADVGTRFVTRLNRLLEKSTTDVGVPLPPTTRATKGTMEQGILVEKIVDELSSEPSSNVILVADRGRGKSSALGLAIRGLTAKGTYRTAVTAGNREAATEVLKFAQLSSDAFVSTQTLLYETSTWDVIVIDEAAQIPVPVLQRIVERHSNATFAFATTTHGYEGTGRGFALRFISWLQSRPCRNCSLHTLTEPIRWAPGDPLELLIFDLLLLNADVPEIQIPDQYTNEMIVHRVLDRDLLISDENLLQNFFGLLVHAHYNTTPSDLHRLLDAPNIVPHALMCGHSVVAATLVAIEGALESKTCDDLYWGRYRVRGHVFPETLASHSGEPNAGTFNIIRSVRTAVHPTLRRRGLASRLVGHVHDTYKPDFFGTLFGLSPGLLQFRRSVGYELVRVGASRGSRTGEPAVAMIRPVTERAFELHERLRMKLARDLSTQMKLMQAGNELLLSDELISNLSAGLPTPKPLSDMERIEGVKAYANGCRTMEATCIALFEFVSKNSEALSQLAPEESALIKARILDQLGWEEAAIAAKLSSAVVAMRALRRAVRALVQKVGPL